VTETEPEWDDDSRGWALALDNFEADSCPGCGSQLSETQRVSGKPFPKYDVSTIVCAKCEIIDAAQHQSHTVEEENRKINEKHHAPGGRLWVAKQVGTWPGD
jgi:hypothetical protein